MSLDDELKDMGYHVYGPFTKKKIYEHLRYLVRLDTLIYLEDNKKIRDLRITKGSEAREDLKNFPNLYLIYILPSQKNKKKK